VTSARSRLADAGARERIRNDLDTSLMCLAGAGAGKTHALVERMVACVGEGKVDIAHMAAITFTRKAAGQRRGRFFLALQDAAAVAEQGEAAAAARQLARLRDAVARVDQCAIGTIHAFCARLLRERPIEAGLPPNFSEVEEREELFLIRAAWDRFLQSLSAAGDPRLLAYLRGPLVGLGDDELYALRVAHWRFRWPVPPPGDGLEADLAERLRRALASLQRLWGDVRERPFAAALERFVEVTGLAAHAAIGDAGSSRAGNLLRVLAMVRDAQSRRGLGWGQITDELRDLLDDDRQRVEEMTLETGRSDVVRVMNLHQAKGLEAKVVFLADAFDTSAQQHRVDMHVSRVAATPYLSMAVTRRARFQTIVLAEPEGWQEDAAEEARFLAAESLRLVYVAATRARDVLVLGMTGQSRGAWAILEPAAASAPELPIPSPAEGRPVSGAGAQTVDMAALQAQTRARWVRARTPSYVLESVSEEEESPPLEDWEESRPRGRRYGTVVHRLLESAVRGRLRDLDEAGEAAYVRCLLADEGIGSTEAEAAVLRALNAFRASTIWQELGRAGGVHVEVPLASQEGDTVPRGVIDLVYRVGDDPVGV
jgi:ATP-dependent helicase/nuclease subunit A